MAETATGGNERGYGTERDKEAVAYIPTMAIFLPGPALARTRGLQVVMPAHNWM